MLTYAAMGVLLAIGLLVFCDTNDKIALRAVEKLEGLAERDHLPFSGTLRDLKTAIVRRNCQDMDSEVLELSDGIRSRARRGGVSSEHDVALSELREAVRKVCGSHGTR